MKTIGVIAGARRSILFRLAAIAVAALATLAPPMPAYAQQEIKLGHVGEPGSLFQISR